MFKSLKESVHLDITIISLLFMGMLSVLIVVNPEGSIIIANIIFVFVTSNFGSLFLWFGFISVVVVLYLSFSKFGDIRLGEGDPEYTTTAWITMIISAGIGSSTVYWAFTEWALYYITPPFNITPLSHEALKWSTPYNFFHWGVSGWAMYALTAIPIVYSYHVRKAGSLKLSVIFQDIIGEKLAKGIIGKIVDIIFIFSAIGGVGITLALSIPLISLAVTNLVPINDSFGVQVGIVSAISILYSFSSYLGIEKGMQNISKFNGYIVIIFLLFCLITGPTRFIIDNTTNALGTMFQNFIKMSLWIDPIDKSSFPKDWTIFFWVYWLTYAPFIGLFIAKISKGRTLREILLGLVVFGGLGTTIFFGIIGSLSLERFLSGKVDVPAIIQTQDGYYATMAVINSMPFTPLVLIGFILMTIFFLATSLDSAAFIMATTTAKKFDNSNNPSPWLRLFWCIILSLVPLTLMFINAPLKTIQTSAFLGTVPLIFILIGMIIVFINWIHKDYGSMSGDDIFKLSNKSEK